MERLQVAGTGMEGSDAWVPHSKGQGLPTMAF